MIRRIVKMTFRPEGVDAFLTVFQRVRDNIRNFDGVHSLELVRDVNNKCIFMTISEWESKAHLERYRHSGLFRETWAQTKVHFAEKAEAWSLEVVKW